MIDRDRLTTRHGAGEADDPRCEGPHLRSDGDRDIHSPVPRIRTDGSEGLDNRTWERTEPGASDETENKSRGEQTQHGDLHAAATPSTYPQAVTG